MVQQRIFSPIDVAKRNTRKACWVTKDKKVYDVTPFLEDHPGGEEYLLKFAGKDLEDNMADKFWHEHSESAYEMMEEFRIGDLGEGESLVDDDWVPDENFEADETNTKADFDKNRFLDLSKPLLIQVWHAPWGKEYYLQQVHSPRHLKESARLFGPDFLEMFTRTKWYVVPIIWAPITAFLFYLSLCQFTDSSVTAKDFLQWPLPSHFPTFNSTAFAYTIPCFLLGNLIWTILEYTMHRFLFHIDDHLPDTNWALMLHFLLHGVHHYLPMDRLRLVMPPLLFFVLETPFTNLAHLIFPKAVANGIIAGAFTFYILYDCMHYALHHTRLPQYLTEMKRYHLAHHYKNYELGFGVTSKLWDWVFHTELY